VNLTDMLNSIDTGALLARVEFYIKIDYRY
jgi:hypothetical protein